jgi:hypothetical protein
MVSLGQGQVGSLPRPNRRCLLHRCVQCARHPALCSVCTMLRCAVCAPCCAVQCARHAALCSVCAMMHCAVCAPCCAVQCVRHAALCSVRTMLRCAVCAPCCAVQCARHAALCSVRAMLRCAGSDRRELPQHREGLGQLGLSAGNSVQARACVRACVRRCKRVRAHVRLCACRTATSPRRGCRRWRSSW